MPYSHQNTSVFHKFAKIKEPPLNVQVKNLIFGPSLQGHAGNEHPKILQYL
jgi:hypothetical protein